MQKIVLKVLSLTILFVLRLRLNFSNKSSYNF